MPVFTIQTPDGREVDIEAADEATAVRGAQEWAQSNPVEKRDSMMLGVLKGMQPAAEKLLPYSPANLIPGFRKANEGATERLKGRIAEREQTEKPNLFGQVAGGLAATGWIPGGPIKSLAPIIQGGAQGYLLSEADTPEGQAVDTVKGAALNHFGGKVMDALGEGIAPVVDPTLRRLEEYGLKFTPGMRKGEKGLIKEERMARRPIVGDAIHEGREAAKRSISTATANKVLEPLGVRVPSVVRPGGPTVDYAKGEIGRAYDMVIPHLKVDIDGPKFAEGVYSRVRNLPEPQQKRLIELMNAELGQGKLAGQQLKDAQGELRRWANSYGRSDDPDVRALGEALHEVDDELTGVMLAQNPDWAPQLAKVNEAYRGYRVMNDASGRAEGQVFTPTQLRQATRRGDSTKSKDASGRGEAFMQDFAGDLEATVPRGVPRPNSTVNPFEFARGALDAVGYNADNVYQAFRYAPRGSTAKRVGATTKRLARPAGAAAAAAGSVSRN